MHEEFQTAHDTISPTPSPSMELERRKRPTFSRKNVNPPAAAQPSLIGSPLRVVCNMLSALMGQPQHANDSSYPANSAAIGHYPSQPSQQSILESTPRRVDNSDTPSRRRRKPAIQRPRKRDAGDRRGAKNIPPAKRMRASQRGPINDRQFACLFFQRSPNAWSHCASCTRSYSDLKTLK
jgi:hypothetical protein